MTFCFPTRPAVLLAAPALIFGLVTAQHADAAVLGIDSITQNGDNSLATATVAAIAYNGGVIADSAADNRGSTGLSFDSAAPLTPGSPAPAGAALISTDDKQGMAFDNNPLTGVAGSVNNTFQGGGALILRWGSSMTDNDDDPDFFVFEDLGNDSVVVQAILGDGTLGAGLALSGWNTVSSAGVLGTGPGAPLTGRTVTGVAFDFTDLLDASGSPLANGTAIQGIVVGDTNDMDPYEVYFNGDVTPAVPEPCSLLLVAMSGVLALRYRSY